MLAIARDFFPRAVEKNVTKTESDARDVIGDLDALRSDVARLAESISALAQHGTQAASHQFTDVVGDAQDKIVSSAAKAQTQFRAAGDDFEARIARNPLTAMSIAFGVGMCFGLLSRSRN